MQEMQSDSALKASVRNGGLVMFLGAVTVMLEKDFSPPYITELFKGGIGEAEK